MYRHRFPHEGHLRGALTNGVTREEIQEVFLQTAIYCGAPAAIDSFRTAKEVFKEMDVAAQSSEGSKGSEG